MKTRLLSTLLAAVLVLAGFPAVAQADEGPIEAFGLEGPDEGLTYAGTATPSWTRGQIDGAFRAFRTGSDHLVAPGPLLDTAATFSVSAWVRLDSSVGNATVLSQGGFALQYYDADDRWSLRMPGGAGNAVNSLAAPTWHAWTHLVGVYDSATQRAQLWVNGVLQGERVIAPTATSAPFAIGAGPAGTDLFEGGLDSVRLYAEAASSTTIHELFSEATDRAHYKLNGTALDEYSGQSGTLSGTAAWVSATHLNLGASGLLVGPRPALTAGQSYAVMAWVRTATVPTTSRAVVGGTGTRFSPYLIAYDGVSRKMEFRVVNAAFNQGWVARSSTALPANTWVHVAGLYDVLGKKIDLYVNGQFQASVPNVVTPAPATELRVGGNVWAGQTVAAWPGDVDDIHVLAGLPTVEHIQQIMQNR